MNQVLAKILERSSIRRFKENSIPQEDIEFLKQAALASPTARNLQKWHFSFVCDKNKINTLEQKMLEVASDDMKVRAKERGMSFFYHAPLMVFISSQDLNHFSLVDAGIAVENIALAAQSLGLSSTIIGCCKDLLNDPKESDLRAYLGFPKGYQFAIAIVIGYSDTTKPPHALDVSKVSQL